MKANEIQIGDWVYIEDAEKESGLALTKVVCITEDNTEWLHPIPLIAEILGKNGWRYDSELNNWWHEGAEFLIWHDEKIGFYCCNITTITLNEVHRLQHLLRLCGLNELADNFKI